MTPEALPPHEIRRHLEKHCPPAGSVPHVWVAPISATTEPQDRDQWLDIGPLDDVCRAYPHLAHILRAWLPDPKLSTSGILDLTPPPDPVGPKAPHRSLRCQVALIGESRR